MAVSPDVPWLVAIGFFAQLVDGCVGMGYGISASSILATLGVPPAMTSATVHAAETVTAGVSSASHAWFRNIDRRIFGDFQRSSQHLAIGGVAWDDQRVGLQSGLDVRRCG